MDSRWSMSMTMINTRCVYKGECMLKKKKKKDGVKKKILPGMVSILWSTCVDVWEGQIMAAITAE